MPATQLRRVYLFQCYAHDDFIEANSLMDRLKHNFAASTAYWFDVWSDRQILVGAAWDQAIKDALACADLGLLLISPAAIGSAYIRGTELPALLAASKVLGVGLRPIDFRTQLPPALQALQVFTLKTATGSEMFYSQCSTRVQKDAFAHELYLALCNRLAAIYANVTGTIP